MFQSTRLREARLINAKCTMINVSFNPRAYVRRDTGGFDSTYVYQSFNPRAYVRRDSFYPILL